MMIVSTKLVKAEAFLQVNKLIKYLPKSSKKMCFRSWKDFTKRICLNKIYKYLCAKFYQETKLQIFRIFKTNSVSQLEQGDLRI